MKNLRSLILLPFVVVQVVAAGCETTQRAEDRQLRARAEGRSVQAIRDTRAAHALKERRTGDETPKPSARRIAPVAVGR